jgi:uncharacterized protein (TIGR02284 family)
MIFPGVVSMPHSSHGFKEAGTAIYAVIQSLSESQEALVEIGEKLADQNLKQFFLAESLKRAEFRGELESVLNREGVGDLRESRVRPGLVEQALADLRLKSRDAGEDTLLATAEQGENAAIEAYDRAMNADLPLPVRHLLASQASHIQESHNVVKSARERAGVTRDAA